MTHLPCNIEAEQALLGCVLFDNGGLERLGDGFCAAHFYEPLHVRLFAAIETAVAQGRLAEPIAMAERLRADAAFEALGGLRYLADLVDHAPPAPHAGDYARIVQDLATRRALMRICDQTRRDAQAGDEPAQAVVEAAEAQLFDLGEHGGASAGFVSFSAALTGAVERAATAFSRDGGLSGLSTGLGDLDRKLGGLHPSDLIILAARPSMGKTALAVNIAFNVARGYAFEAGPEGRRRTVAGGIVAFFSLEMSEDQLATRILAEVSGVSSDRIRKGRIDADAFGRIRDAAQAIAAAPLHIDATGALPIAKLAARARRLKRQGGLDLIVVDYLQLVTASNARRGDNRVQEVSEVTMALKALAKELDVPVIALSQLSRAVEGREDKRPMLGDLRESGSIEQDADVVMFLYRDAYYLARKEPREGSAEHIAWQDQMQAARGQADLIIGKQRHGPIGTVRLAFDEDLTRFSDPPRLTGIDPAHVRNPYGDD